MKQRPMQNVNKKAIRRTTLKFEDLTPEQQAKADACKTPQEFFDFVKEEGLELTEGQLNAVAGGSGFWSERPCPKCGSFCTGPDMRKYVDGEPTAFTCFDCGHNYMDRLGK